jgi:hypothetical protein
MIVLLVHSKRNTVKKIKKKATPPKVTDDQIKLLERIEKRIDELHEKVEHLNDRHREVLGLFEDHMVKHHKKIVEPLPPPPNPSLLPTRQSSVAKDARPGPHPEALHPEGPPENMSLGDDYGEIERRTGPEPLKTTIPKKELKKCTKCGGDVKSDLAKCPTCGAKL